MMRGMGNMQGMMKQMQKLQKEMGAAQDKLNAQEFVGSASNDLVKVTFTGDKKMVSVEISPDVVDPEDVEILQDMIFIATNDALEQIDAESERTVGKYAKNIPGM